MNKRIEYNSEFQKLLIDLIISDNNLFALSRNIIKPEYWDTDYRRTIEFILDYSDEYKNVPTPEIILAETRKKYQKIDNITSDISDWYLDSIENFCRHKDMERLIYDGPELLEKGEYGTIESRVKESVMISLQKDLGLDYFSDPKTRIELVKDRKNMVSTGWSTVDKALYGGFNRGEITFFAGGPGTGKSLFLQNMCLNWSMMGLNVIYITLELSEILISLRMDAMVAETSTKNVIKDTDSVALKILSIARGDKTPIKPGKIQVKKMSEAGTTVNDIRSYIKEYEIQTGLKVDAICVDYLDLLYPNSKRVDINSSFNKDKYTSEELRGLAAELNILCVSASQLNRCLSGDTIVYQENNLFDDSLKGIRKEDSFKQVKIKDVKIGDWVLGQGDFVKVTNVFVQGKQLTYKITLENGKEIFATSNHRFPSNKGLRSIDTGLEIGMALESFNHYHNNDPKWKIREAIESEYSPIVSIEEYDIEETYDIEVESESHLFYANGILTHNSSVQESDYDISHIAGGISKINTADNVIAIMTSSALRDNGEYQIQFLKTRSSNGVGQRLYLSFDKESLRIVDKVDPNTSSDSSTSKFTEFVKKKNQTKLSEDTTKKEEQEEQEESNVSTEPTRESKIAAALEKLKKK